MNSFNSPTKIDGNTFYICIICIICVFTIIVYGTYRCKTVDFHDPLTESFFEGHIKNFFDGWGILHYFFYAMLGYTFPRKLPLIFIFGVLWEIIETIFQSHPFYISKCNYHASDTDNGQWWYGRWQDIIMNTTGMFTGYYIATRR